MPLIFGKKSAKLDALVREFRRSAPSLVTRALEIVAHRFTTTFQKSACLLSRYRDVQVHFGLAGLRRSVSFNGTNSSVERNLVASACSGFDPFGAFAAVAMADAYFERRLSQPEAPKSVD
jgi:hypothetical protein